MDDFPTSLFEFGISIPSLLDYSANPQTLYILVLTQHRNKKNAQTCVPCSRGYNRALSGIPLLCTNNWCPMATRIPTFIGTILLLCLPVFLGACSTLRYGNKLELTESSGWKGENFGNYQKHTFAHKGDSIDVVHSDNGTFLSFGPPFLPIIPLFGGYTPPQHLFDITIWHTYTGSDSLEINKMQFFANSTMVLEPTVEYSSVREGPAGTFRELYRLLFHYPLDKVSTLHICFDSLSVRGEYSQVPPITLVRTKRIFHKFIFTH